MDYLARKFLEGRFIGWIEMRKLYKHYKKYCHILGVGVLDLSVVDELIEWETAFATGSILLRSGEKPEPSDKEIFNTATLLGEMEYWFYRLREQDRTLSDVLLLSVMDRRKGEDVAEQIGVLDVGDNTEKRYYWSQTGIPHMVEKACRRLAKIRNRSIDMLNLLDKSAGKC